MVATNAKTPVRKAQVKAPAKPAAKRTVAKKVVQEASAAKTEVDEAKVPVKARPTAAEKEQQQKEAIKAATHEAMNEIIQSPEFTENLKQKIREIVSVVFKERADKALSHRRASLTTSSHPRPDQKQGRNGGNKKRNQQFRHIPPQQTAKAPAALQRAETISVSGGAVVVPPKTYSFDYVMRTMGGEDITIQVPFYEVQPGDDPALIDIVLGKAARVDRLFQKVRDSFTMKDDTDVKIIAAIFKEIVAKTFGRDSSGVDHKTRMDVYEDILGRRSMMSYEQEEAELLEKISGVVTVGLRSQVLPVAESMIRVMR